VKVASEYKRAALLYIWEAISLYLEWKQEKELESMMVLRSASSWLECAADNLAGTNSSAQNIIDYFIKVIDRDFGSPTRCWGEAAEWGMNTQPAGSWLGHHFRRWWLRAAMASAHAYWLVKEREKAEWRRSRKPIEPWRLYLPGRVGHYDEDCGIYSILGIVNPKPLDDRSFPDYTDDRFNTAYNITQMEAREMQSQSYGWPHYSFLYGTPVSRSHRPNVTRTSVVSDNNTRRRTS
jgi:hypothetical protein